MKPTDKELALYEGEELLPISEELEITDEKLREEFELLVEYAIEYKTVTEGRSLTADEVEQIKTDLRNEVSKGRPSGFGAKFQPAALPMETQRPPSDKPTIGEAVSMQQTVGQGRKAPATYSPTLDLNLQTKQKLVELFKASQTPEAGVLSPEALKQMERDAETDAESLVFAYDRLTEQFPGMSPEQKMEEVISALQTMNNVPTVKESALDPEMIEKFKGQDWYDKLAKALAGQVTEGSFKAYTPVQADILSYQMKNRIDRYADRVYPTMFREPADLVSVKSPKGNFVVPREVFEYIGEVGLGTIYDNETDFAIRKVYLGEEGRYYGMRGREGQTISQAPNKRKHAEALSKVRAYNRIDYDWTIDNDRRQFIIDHLDDFKNEGWFTTTTAFGGVSESGTSWLLRNALAVPNALTGAGISVAKDIADVGIELATGEEAPLAKATIAERQANAPIYAEDSFMADIYDSVARNKGFLDESDIVIEAFGIQDPYAKGVIYGTSAIADFLNPDLDIISGTLKGTQKATRAIQASRRLYDSTDYKQAAKAFAEGFNDEIMDSTNLISITNNTIKKVGGKTVDNLTDGDIRLTFGQQVARNLEAQDYMNIGKEDELIRLGLDDTPYYRMVKESGKEQADEFFFGNIRKNDNARELHNEYQDTQIFLDDVERFGYDTAVQRAKNQGLHINLKTIDDIVKSEAPLSIEDALPSIRKGVASVYGRAIMFEMAPSIRDMEAVVQITPRLYAGKKVADEIRITSSLTDIGKRLYNITKLPFGEDLKPAEAAATELFGAPVIKEGRLTKFYDLSELSAEDKFQLKIDLDYLDIAPTKRAQIIEDIDNNKLYNDDHRMIVDRNTERALLTDGRVATVDDINRLDAVEQRKLLEAADTSARSGLREGPVMQATKSFLSNLIGEQIFRYIPDDFGKAHIVFKNNLAKIMTPQVELRRSFNIQQSTALRKAEGQIQTLELRALREYDRLTKVMPADEALSHMIVGELQNELGQISQMENIENALSWMVDQLFVRVGTTINADASAQSLISGYSAKISNEVFSADGLVYKQYLLNQVVKKAIQNPKILWAEMENVILKLNDALRKPRVTYINEDGVKQTVRVRGITVKPDEIQLYRGRNLEDGMAQIALGTYMATEIRRITKEVIVEQIDEQLIKVSVDNVLPNIDIKQQEYADLLREATQILYVNRTFRYSESIDDIGDVVQQYYRQKTLDALNELDPDFDYTNIRPEVKKVLDSFKKNIKKEGKNDKALFKELMGEDIKEKVQKYNELIDETYQADVKRIKQNGKDLVAKYKKQKFEEYDVEIKKYNRKKDKQKIKELRAQRNQEIADYAEQVRQQKSAELSMLASKRNESKRQYLESLREYQVNTIAQIKSKTQLAIEGLDEAWAATEGMSDMQLIKWLEDNDLPLSFQMQQLKSVMETDFVSRETSKIISEQLYDQSKVVIRNNRLNNDHIVPAKDMVELFDSMFGKENETLFKALLGGDVYDDLLESLQNRGYGFVQDNIRKVLQADPNLFDGIDKLHGYMKSAFYTSILGLRLKYHIQNIISAPAIIYQTLGSNKLFNGYNIKELATKSRLIVVDGSSVGSRNYNEVAVITKDGRSYTYGDLFEALEETGAKTEFTYIMSSLRDGQLLKDIQRATRKPGVGIGKNTMNVLNNILNNLNLIGDKTTGFASNCDMTFRAAVLIKGLEDGKSLDESAKLASRSLFDYNEISFQGIGGRIVNTGFVFTSFFISNNFDLIRAFSDPSILKRYAYTLKVSRDLNKVQRIMNDDQDLPYNMYYPEFAQSRIKYGYKEDKLGRDASFKMLPPLPAIEALQFQSALFYPLLGEAVGQDTNYTKVGESVLNMLDPAFKELSDIMLNTNFANVYSYTPLTYVQGASMMSNGDPQDIAAQIEWLTGSQVYPQYVGPNKLNNHNGYLYKFKDKEQANVFKRNWIRMVGSITGAETMINAALRPAAPQGSTYGNLTDTERALAFFGFLTPARMDTPEKQQLELMKGTLSNIRKMKNQYEKQILDKELAPKNTDDD